MKNILYTLKLACLCLAGILVTSTGVAQTRVVGYLPTWNNIATDVDNIDFGVVTHVNIAFSNPSAATNWNLAIPAGLLTAAQKVHAKGAKILLSIAGGEGIASDYSYVLNSARVDNFVAHLVQTTVTYQLDGIDVDIEGGILNGSSVTAAMYETFVKKLAAGLHAQGKLVTCAIATAYGSQVTSAAAQEYDFINIMSYDATGPWTPNNPAQHSTYQMAVNDVAYWNTQKGVAKNKLVVGVPFYGYGWGSYGNANGTVGAYTFGDIVNRYPGAENADQQGSGANALYYNGIPTIKSKTTFGKNEAGGVMIWQLLGDATGSKSLLAAIKSVIGNTTPNKAPTVSLTGPANNTSFNAPATVNISANAADTDGSITQVQFFNGAASLGTDNTAPYTFAWTNVAAGTYSITARATDNGGLTTTSSPVSITVNNVSTFPIKEYTVNKVSTAITVDGVLNETAWVNAPATDNLINMNGTVATQSAKAKMLWSDTHLYFAFNIQDASIWASFTTRDAALWTQDVLEVLIDRDGDGVNYAELGFAPNASLYDLLMDKPYSTGGNGNSAWNIDNLIVKTTNSSTGWIVEVALPFAGIPATPASFGKPNAGDVWRVNFARADHDLNVASSEKLYTWTYTDGISNHVPARFGKITFGNGPATPNVAPTVNITAPSNNATFNAPASINITANAADADGTISQVQFFNGAASLGTDNAAPYTFSWNNVAAGTYILTAKATDNSGAVTTSSAVTVVVNPVASTQSPYGGVPQTIPGTIQAENYDLGGQGIAFNETTTANQGNAYRTTEAVDVEANTTGFNVGYIVTDEWIEYTVNVTTGTYKIDAKVAAIAAGKTFRLELDGATIANFTVPNTGAWNVFQVATVNNVTVTAGQKILRVYATSTDFNIDAITFSATTTTPNVPPTVSITAPSNGTAVNAPASINITANAADADGTVSQVQFFNGAVSLGTDNAAPYSFSWTNVAAGTYTITAKATDNSGAVTTSAAVTVIVNTVTTPNQPPVVSLTAPTATTYTAPASINIAANASDADGAVSQVQFFNGSTPLGTDASAPYTYSWTNVAAGTYTITAKATDNSGAVTTSASITLTVSPAQTNTCSSIAQYVENGNYAPGSKVKNANNQYQCKPFPYSGWCNGVAWAYAPGTGAYWSDAWILVGSCTSGRDAQQADVNEKALTNSPNPFTGSTLIEVVNAQAGEVTVAVYNKTGQLVHVISEGHLDAGTHQFVFDASGLNADLYIVKCNSGSGVITRKIMKTE